MMAGYTGKLGVLRPGVLFGAPGEALHRGAQLHRLPYTPIAYTDPARILSGLPWR